MLKEDYDNYIRDAKKRTKVQKFLHKLHPANAPTSTHVPALMTLTLILCRVRKMTVIWALFM